MKVCLVKTSSMGDMLHTLPALTDAQQAIPNIQIDWVAEENFVEIPSWHKSVNRVIPIALRRWRKTPFSAQVRQEWQKYREQLQLEQYDAVIDAQGLFKSALFATRLAKGIKYGYDRHSAREGLASLFYDKCFAIPYQQHAVERIRHLFALTLDYPIPTTQGDYAIAQHFVTTTQSAPYLMFIHATTRDDKHWPEQYWRELIKHFQQTEYRIKLPFGNENERLRAVRLAQDFEHVEVLPKMTLSEVADQLAQATAVVSVDTGLSHLSAALDKPNITLFGASDPTLVGGYGKNQVVLSAQGMQNISAQQVITQLEKILTR